MHQVSLETMCPLKAFQLPYCPDNDAKSMVKHLIFLQKFAVLSNVERNITKIVIKRVGKLENQPREMLQIWYTDLS